MAELPVATRSAIDDMIGRSPDTVLRGLASALRSLPGDRARGIRGLIEDETSSRITRNTVFGPLAAMFRPRPDGVEAHTFPPSLLALLWRALSEREPRLVEQARIVAADVTLEAPGLMDRLCASAAGILRDETASPAWRCTLAVREDLAAYLDLAPLARPMAERLPEWARRVDSASEAELRLAVRDASAMLHDGAPRLLEILFANLCPAHLILRLAAHASAAGGDERFLAGSELSSFVERLLSHLEAEAASAAAFDLRKVGPGGVEALAASMACAAATLSEFSLTLNLSPDGVWGRRTTAVRNRFGDLLSDLIGRCEKLVDQALPLERVTITGRMTRAAPKLDAPLAGPAMDQAMAAMTLFASSRATAAAYGCSGRRAQVSDALINRLIGYTDESLETLNAGEVEDPSHALCLVNAAADFLAGAGDEETARVVRRRAAAAAQTLTPSQRYA